LKSLNLKQLTGDVGFYFFLNASPRLLAFITVPILTRIFSPADYGVIETIVAFTSLISTFAVFGFSTAIFKYYQDLNTIERKELISTACLFRLAVASILVIFIAIFSSAISKQLFSNVSYSNYLIIALIALPFAVVIDVAIDVCRLTFKKKYYSFMTLVQPTGLFLLVIVLVVFFKLRLSGYFLASTIVTIMVSGIALYAIKSDLSVFFSFGMLKKLIMFGMPLMIIPISLWVTNLSNRFFLTQFVNLNETGLYAIGYKVAALLTLVVAGFQLAFSPIAYAHYKESDAPTFFRLVFAVFNILIFGFGMFLTLFSIEILTFLVPHNYLEGHKIVGLLSLSIIFNGAIYFVTMGISFAEKTKYVAYSHMAGALINITLNFALIPQYGMVGAAFSAMISYVFIAAIGNYWNKKCYPDISYSFYKVIIITICFLLFDCANIFIVFNVNIKVFMFIGYIMLLLYIFKNEILTYLSFRENPL